MKLKNISIISLLILLMLVVVYFFLDIENNKAPDLVSESTRTAKSQKEYVGDEVCRSCHQPQYSDWRNSHHDLAMQEVNERTVLGDFNGKVFDYFGLKSEFYKKDEHYYVKTDGADGNLKEFRIAYTFGVHPLQQYLIEFPGGRYQMLNIAWDSRSKQVGGQRWFHLYPNEQIKHNDPLHWTGINHNWNFMCADCHSTNLQKNYNADTKRYQTSWSSIDVSCESCHGPAAAHVAWVESESTNSQKPSAHKGFTFSFNDRKDISWVMDLSSGNAKRSKPNNHHIEVETCAQCHSRRSRQSSETQVGDDFLNHFTPALLTEPLYHADGQINDEVYVYGSFLQSKMFHQGVTCSDCHDPHSLKLRAEDNSLCSQCHLPSKYDSETHHFHPEQSEGAQCVSCHMPDKLFMVVDARRDHSLRIPRPDLSLKYDVPNACSQCHSDKTIEWAANVYQQQYGKSNAFHYSQALYAARQGLSDAEALLTRLIKDQSQPSIARATALQYLSLYLSEQSLILLKESVSDSEALIRLGLSAGLDQLPEQPRKIFAASLLFDQQQSVRRLASEALLGISLQGLPAEVIEQYKGNLEAYKQSENFNADRPESLLNLARLSSLQGQFAKTEQYLRDAISIAPYFSPAYVNLADHFRDLNNDASGEAILKQGLLAAADKTPLHHALGLLLVRQKQYQQAIDYLRLAANSETTNARYQYVYAIALHSLGQSHQAIKVLEQAQQQFMHNNDILQALISIHTELGNSNKSQQYKKILDSLSKL